MGLESVTHITDLNTLWPLSTDAKSSGDDHLRNIKVALKTDLANVTGAVTATHTDLNTLAGAATTGGVGLNVATQAVGNSTTLAASTAFVAATAMSAALPAQTGNSGKFVTTNGTTASWAVSGIGAVAAIVASTTLTASSAGYQQTQMTAIGQSVTMPDATTLSVGTPRYYIDNSKGGYPVGIRDSAGTLLMGVAAGGTAYVSLESASTAAGVWSITGTNLEPGLITIDNTFSSTYSSTGLLPFVALDTNKSLHFLAIASGFAAVAVDKVTGAVGTPVTVSTTASAAPRAVFKITSTTAIVFYHGGTTGTLIGAVISLSGATTLAVGTPSSTLTATGVAVDNFVIAPKIAQLDTTLYLVSYATATGAGTTSVAAFQVSGGTTVNLGSAVNIIAANNCVNSTTTYPLTTLTGFVSYKSGAAAPYTNSGVVVSVTNANPPVCTVGTPASLTGVTSAAATAMASCQLSSTVIMYTDDNNGADALASVWTVSAGTTVTAGTAVTYEATMAPPTYVADGATRYNPHLFPLSATTALLWYIGTNVSRCIVLTNTAGTVTKGSILYNSISRGAVSATNGGTISPQGITEFIAIQQTGAANAWGKFAKPHLITGTTITEGASQPLDGFSMNGGVSSSTAWRLSSGNYVISPLMNSTGMGWPELPVLRSNGVAVNYRGSIKTPVMSFGGTQGGGSSAEVSSNRLVLLGEADFSTIDAASTYQLRLLSVEIAA